MNYHERAPRGQPVPIVVSIPHTGTELPQFVADRFASEKMRDLPMTDWHLHKLYDFLPELGITTLYARFSRLVIDLNRAPDARQLYPGRFETSLVATETFDGDRLFREAPDAGTVDALRLEYHVPYHRRLAGLLQQMSERFGRVVLIDAHSIASRANRLHAALEHEIYLGDRDGAACEPWLTETASNVFANAGLRVRINDPYKGGYITDNYGSWPGVDALQIEMCQRLYMNEDRIDEVVVERWERMKKVLTAFFATLAQQLEQN